MQLSDAQRLDWLRLIRSENVGPRTFRTLVNRYGGAGPALEALPHLAKQGGRTIRVVVREDCEREMEAIQKFGARLLCLGEDDYPKSLRAIDAPPPVFSCWEMFRSSRGLLSPLSARAMRLPQGLRLLSVLPRSLVRRMW